MGGRMKMNSTGIKQWREINELDLIIEVNAERKLSTEEYDAIGKIITRAMDELDKTLSNE